MGKLEEIIGKIRGRMPEYAGYHSREFIADSDRVLRHNLANEVEKRKIDIERVRDSLLPEEKRYSGSGIDETLRRLNILAEKFRQSGYESDKSWPEKMTEEELETVYEYDLALLDQVEKLNTPIERLEKVTGSPDLFREELSLLGESLDILEDHYNRRGEVLGRIISIE